jgi:hypothetical protein
MGKQPPFLRPREWTLPRMEKDCWTILRIAPTEDLAAIKAARRALIKVWHPDRADTPYTQQLRAGRCAEINAAFDKAVERAKSAGTRAETVRHQLPAPRHAAGRSLLRKIVTGPLKRLHGSVLSCCRRRA